MLVFPHHAYQGTEKVERSEGQGPNFVIFDGILRFGAVLFSLLELHTQKVSRGCRQHHSRILHFCLITMVVAPVGFFQVTAELSFS